MYLLRKGHEGPFQKPGDILVAEDERAAYTVHMDGSLRRVKGKVHLDEIKRRLQELKKQAADQEAAKQSPLTAVDQKTLGDTVAALAIGEALRF